MGDGSGSAYSSTPIEASSKQAFPSVSTGEAKDALLKWNMLPFMQAKAFRFDQAFAPEQSDAFLRDFFASAAVQEAAPVCTGPGSNTNSVYSHVYGQFGPLGNVESVKYPGCRRPCCASTSSIGSAPKAWSAAATSPNASTSSAATSSSPTACARCCSTRAPRSGCSTRRR